MCACRRVRSDQPCGFPLLVCSLLLHHMNVEGRRGLLVQRLEVAEQPMFRPYAEDRAQHLREHVQLVRIVRQAELAGVHVAHPDEIVERDESGCSVHVQHGRLDVGGRGALSIVDLKILYIHNTEYF